MLSVFSHVWPFSSLLTISIHLIYHYSSLLSISFMRWGVVCLIGLVLYILLLYLHSIIHPYIIVCSLLFLLLLPTLPFPLHTPSCFETGLHTHTPLHMEKELAKKKKNFTCINPRHDAFYIPSSTFLAWDMHLHLPAMEWDRIWDSVSPSLSLSSLFPMPHPSLQK